jgi:hypothetical protein
MQEVMPVYLEQRKKSPIRVLDLPVEENLVEIEAQNRPV